MRQDAVMEQVFDVVNRILQRDLETKKRKLRVRDYKVIPLSTQAGLLEFVSNTSPIQGWLWSAHPKYRPTDLKHREVDGALRRKQREDAITTDDMLKLFLTLRNRFQPVFRHYFTECHKTPSAWFAMRLAYTRSVATTSIVGHIIGLGDRHPSNILMDKASGEVVHIDLGIAFDQGKALPVPERVPFRMTADMVDAMGVTGTQGVFQRCAEETLRVLRDGSETIMTVLEVFRHDPLHTWTVSGDKAKRVQGGRESAGAGAGALGTVKGVLGIDLQSDYVAEAADRALSTVARKLGTNLSVEYTVNELLAEATDPFHLANMFPGECFSHSKAEEVSDTREVGWGPQY
jgi:ataxia telangiectasia mutated family protein